MSDQNTPLLKGSKHQLILGHIAGLLILASAFLSYNNNFFGVVLDSTFVHHDIGSEQLVLDGLLHASDMEGRPILGRYTRPEIERQWPQARKLYAANNRSGEFFHYRSQYGLQLQLFNFLSKYLGFSREALNATAALLMSVVVFLFFIAIRNAFSVWHATIFCLPMIFSPWVVVFARHLYWVEFTWFLPTLVSLFLARIASRSVIGSLLLAVLLFAAFTIKFLSGYEYITTIVLAATVPLVGALFEKNRKLIVRILPVVACFTAAGLSFLASISIHAQSLGPEWSAGLREIETVARKRAVSEMSESAIEEICSKDEVPNQGNCRLELQRSLARSTAKVVAKYFVMPRALPWVQHIRHDPQDLERLRDLRRDPSVGAAITTALEISPISYLRLTLRALEAALLVGLTIIGLGFVRARRDSLAVALAVSFVAPLSWYVLAKGHSDIHYYLNYVLWYLLFVPFALFFIFDSVLTRKKRARENLGKYYASKAQNS